MPPLFLNGVERSTTEADLIDFVVDAIAQRFLRSGDTFVMDNYAVHRSSNLREYLRLAGVSLLFLPKYCPELNPIELVWSKIKYSIRKIKTRAPIDCRSQKEKSQTGSRILLFRGVVD